MKYLQSILLIDCRFTFAHSLLEEMDGSFKWCQKYLDWFRYLNSKEYESAISNKNNMVITSCLFMDIIESHTRIFRGIIIVKDSWFTIQEIDHKTFAISEYGHWEKVHSFLLVGNEKAALIDTGLGIDNIKRITDQLTDLPIVVLTTHVHADHIGSHGEFENVYVHEADSDWLTNGIEGLTIEQIRRDISRDITIPTPKTFNPETYKPYQGIPTGILQDGDMIDIGKRELIIHHTPGHSPGHICVFDKTNGYLFTGDLLYDETPIYAFYPSTDPLDLVDSWEKISKIPYVTKIYGSHNTLGLEPSIQQELVNAVKELKEKDLVKFGTGVHQFKGFSVKF